MNDVRLWRNSLLCIMRKVEQMIPLFKLYAGQTVDDDDYNSVSFVISVNDNETRGLFKVETEYILLFLEDDEKDLLVEEYASELGFEYDEDTHLFSLKVYVSAYIIRTIAESDLNKSQLACLFNDMILKCLRICNFRNSINMGNCSIPLPLNFLKKQIITDTFIPVLELIAKKYKVEFFDSGFSDGILGCGFCFKKDSIYIVFEFYWDNWKAPVFGFASKTFIEAKGELTEQEKKLESYLASLFPGEIENEDWNCRYGSVKMNMEQFLQFFRNPESFFILIESHLKEYLDAIQTFWEEQACTEQF